MAYAPVQPSPLRNKQRQLGGAPAMVAPIGQSVTTVVLHKFVTSREVVQTSRRRVRNALGRYLEGLTGRVPSKNGTIIIVVPAIQVVQPFDMGLSVNCGTYPSNNDRY